MLVRPSSSKPNLPYAHPRSEGEIYDSQRISWLAHREQHLEYSQEKGRSEHDDCHKSHLWQTSIEESLSTESKNLQLWVIHKWRYETRHVSTQGQTEKGTDNVEDIHGSRLVIHKWWQRDKICPMMDVRHRSRDRRTQVMLCDSQSRDSVRWLLNQICTDDQTDVHHRLCTNVYSYEMRRMNLQCGAFSK